MVKGLFMALQPKLIACGNSTATFAMAVRFFTGPAVMAVAAMAIGLRGDLLRVAIVQVNYIIFVISAEFFVRCNLTKSCGNVVGGIASRDRAVRVCKRVQCSSRNLEYRVMILNQE